MDTTCSDLQWTVAAKHRGVPARWRCGRLTGEAPQRPSTFGLTAACHAPTSIFDGSSTEKLWRHGVGVGCDEAETPRRTPVTLLAAAAVGVCKFGTKKSLTKAKDIAVESASRCDLHLAVCLCYRRPQVRAA